MQIAAFINQQRYGGAYLWGVFSFFGYQGRSAIGDHPYYYIVLVADEQGAVSLGGNRPGTIKYSCCAGAACFGISC